MSITFSHPLHRTRLAISGLLAEVFPRAMSYAAHHDIYGQPYETVHQGRVVFPVRQQRALSRRIERQALTVLSALDTFSKYARKDWEDAAKLALGLSYGDHDPQLKRDITLKQMAIYNMAPEPSMALTYMHELLADAGTVPALQAAVALETLSLQERIAGSDFEKKSKLRDQVAEAVGPLLAGEHTEEYLFSYPLGALRHVAVYDKTRCVIRDLGVYWENLSDYAHARADQSGGSFRRGYVDFMDSIHNAKAHLRDEAQPPRPSFEEVLRAKAQLIS